MGSDQAEKEWEGHKPSPVLNDSSFSLFLLVSVLINDTLQCISTLNLRCWNFREKWSDQEDLVRDLWNWLCRILKERRPGTGYGRCKGLEARLEW